MTRVAGWLEHASLAAAIACLYAAFFHFVGEDHLLAWGAVGGLVHFTIGGAVVGALFPLVQHRPDEPGPPGQTRGWLSRPHPSFAYRRYGPRDVLTFLGGHLTFGVLLDVLYPALHPALGVWRPPGSTEPATRRLPDDGPERSGAAASAVPAAADGSCGRRATTITVRCSWDDPGHTGLHLAPPPTPKAPP